MSTAIRETVRCGRCGIVDLVEEFPELSAGRVVCRRCLGDPARTPGRPGMPTEALLEALIRWHRERGAWPTQTQWNASRSPSERASSTYRLHFGTWSRAIAAAQGRMGARP
jgi:hypothetical protein